MGERTYVEGEMVRDIEWKAACDNCFCAMGAIRCVPLACAPPLQGCSPIVREGQCCPSTYNCSELHAGIIPGIPLPLLPLGDSMARLGIESRRSSSISPAREKGRETREKKGKSRVFRSGSGHAEKFIFDRSVICKAVIIDGSRRTIEPCLWYDQV